MTVDTVITATAESEPNPDKEDGGKPRVHILRYALYCSSIIIGAGILTLPVLVAQIGLVPAVVLTLILGLSLMGIYVRIARSIHDYVHVQVEESYEQGARILQEAKISRAVISEFADHVMREEARRKGIGLLDEICAWLGFGLSGRVAIVVGLFAYVVPACIGYVTVGGKTLSAIASLAQEEGFAPVWPAVVAVLAMLCSLLMTRLLPYFTLRATIAKILQMSASWIAGVWVLMLAPLPSWVAIMLFAAGTVGVIWRPSGAEVESASGTLSAEHRVGTFIASFELIVLAATAGLAVFIVVQHRRLIMPALVAPGLDLHGAATACGVLLFAYTGTGIFNLIRYPHLFRTDGKRSALERVVGWGAVIPTIAYLGWMVAVALCVSATDLLAVDRKRSYPTIPLAQTIARLDGTDWAVWVVAAGLFVALLAVTGACMGFSESLADRIARIGNRAVRHIPTTQAPSSLATRIAQVGVLLCATAAATALAVLPSNLQFSGLLAVAGAAGGGMLLLELPFFIPTRGRRHGRKWEISLATVMAIILVAITWISNPPNLGHDPLNATIGIVILAIITIFIIAVAALIVGEPREGVSKDSSR